MLKPCCSHHYRVDNCFVSLSASADSLNVVLSSEHFSHELKGHAFSRYDVFVSRYLTQIGYSVLMKASTLRWLRLSVHKLEEDSNP
ncbi:hypothetical protein N665_0366s0022 [Sinapis alba]|nr:hypothetical protein N665_0366s0022 [Sinapis alba]